MARPLVEAMQVTGRIASGELASRVPVRRGDYAEFASLAGSINDMAQTPRGRPAPGSAISSSRCRTTCARRSRRSEGSPRPFRTVRSRTTATRRRDHRRVPPAGVPGGRPARPHQLEARQMSISLRTHRRSGGGHDHGGGVQTRGDQVGAADRGGRSQARRPPRDGAGAPVPPGLPVAADPDRLAQLLANLLENVITFARTTVSVSLARAPGSGACVITVDDDGPGIVKGDLARVFERFYQADRGPNRRMGRASGWPSWPSSRPAMGGRCGPSHPSPTTAARRVVVTSAPWRGAVPEAVHT